MTQPVECLQQIKCGESKGQQEAPPWVWDVSAMLIEAKTACSDVRFIKAVFGEIQKILEDVSVNLSCLELRLDTTVDSDIYGRLKFYECLSLMWFACFMFAKSHLYKVRTSIHIQG